MKKFLLPIAGFLLSFSLFSQAPNAVCYQAAAKDALGNDLIGQEISIRASVVRGNPSGTVQWEEIHMPMTDQFGLFTIDIGEGTSTGNGAQPNFSDINWGDGTYWLRIEMDATGGMSYELMGTTQIISVPYSLYANGAERAETAAEADHASFADSANVANVAVMALEAQTAVTAQSTLMAVSSDTAMYAHQAATALDDDDKDATNEIQSLHMDGDTLQLVDASGAVTPGASIVLGDNSSTNEIQSLTLDNGLLTISGGNTVDMTNDGLFSGPGASPDFPQGIIGEHIILLDQLYTVPNGKTLYVTSGAPFMKIQGYGTPGTGYTEHPTTPNMPILPEGTQISECFCTGFLIDYDPEAIPVVIDLTTTAGYSVPAGKVLFVKSGIPSDLPGRLIVDDQEMEFFRPNLTRGSRIVCFPENVLLKKPALYNELILTGYLVPSD